MKYKAYYRNWIRQLLISFNIFGYDYYDRFMVSRIAGKMIDMSDDETLKSYKEDLLVYCEVGADISDISLGNRRISFGTLIKPTELNFGVDSKNQNILKNRYRIRTDLSKLSSEVMEMPVPEEIFLYIFEELRKKGALV